METRLGVLLALAATLPGAELSIGTASVAPGGTANLSVRFRGQGARVAALQFDLAYDRSHLKISAQAGSIAWAAGKSLSSADVGSVKRLVIRGLSQNVLSDGSVADLSIQFDGTAAGTYPLAISNAEGTDAAARPVAVAVSGGWVTVEAAGKPPWPGNGSGDQPATVTLTWPPVNGANGYDVHFGTSPWPPFTAALSGRPLAMPASKRAFAVEAGRSTAAPASVSLGTVTLAGGGRGGTGATLVSSGAQVAAVQFDLIYDRSALTVVEAAGSAAVAAGKTLIAGDVASGRRFFIAGLNQTAIPDGSLVDLTVIASAGASGSYPLTVSNLSASDPLAHSITVNGSDGSAVVQPQTRPPGLRFVALAPCRISDTRSSRGALGGPRLNGGESRTIPIPASSCGVPANAAAYSLNVTVVPAGPLSYLTLWPAGETQPYVSTLNSFDGRIKANAAIVPAGTNGAVNVFVTNPSDVILDITGYFTAAGNLAYYAVPACRVADTRGSAGLLGGPVLSGGQSRVFPVLQSNCNLPANAQAYSLNFTVVPRGSLAYLTTWPAGQAQPYVSTLNSLTGSAVANAAIVAAGSGGGIGVYATDTTDLVIDVNGYFAPPGGAGALSLYTAVPCRVLDTRLAAGALGGPALAGGQSRTFDVIASSCAIPGTAQGYSLNATVIPARQLGYLSLWPAGGAIPLVSTLNSPDGSVAANAAIVPAGTNGGVSVFVTDTTDLTLDINGYFAP